MELAKYYDRHGGPLGRLQDRMSDLFGQFFEDWPTVGPVAVPMDVAETENAYTIRAELPGVSIDDVEITIDNNVLSISGEKAERKEQTDHEVRLTERRYGRFHRAMRLPRGVESDGVKADYSDGVLTITLPKSEKAKAKRIEVRK